MKQVEFISRHGRNIQAREMTDKSSMTEQNLRLSQAEKAIDMANGRIPIIPSAIIAQQPDPSEMLPDDLQTMLGAYHNPYIDPATRSQLFQTLRYRYADHIAKREAEQAEAEKAKLTAKEDEYARLLARLRADGHLTPNKL